MKPYTTQTFPTDVTSPTPTQLSGPKSEPDKIRAGVPAEPPQEREQKEKDRPE